MQRKNKIAGITARFVLITMSITMMFLGTSSCGERSAKKNVKTGSEILASIFEDNNTRDESQSVNALLVSPKNPHPGELFHVLAVGGKNIRKAQIAVSGPSDSGESQKTRNGDGMPFWRIDEFEAGTSGKYQVTLTTK